MIAVIAATIAVVIRSMRRYPPLSSSNTAATDVAIAHGYSGRARTTWAIAGVARCRTSASHGAPRGNARCSACPTPPAIAPSCATLASIMMSHHHTSQCAPSRGPGSSLIAPSVGLPELIAYRPSSICTNTLMTQLNRISQRKRNPYCAPSAVVSSSSPDPMMLPANTMPGPIFRSAAMSVAGGSCTASAGMAYGSNAVASPPPPPPTTPPSSV